MSSVPQIHAHTEHKPLYRRNHTRLLDIDQHIAWREFQHWWETRAARGVPARTRYSDNPRQAQLRPAMDDRLIWGIDFEKCFAQLAPSHQGILIILAEGDSLAIQAHKFGTSVRTMLRRRESALTQLVAIRRRYAEKD
jgi:hypothetical protein